MRSGYENSGAALCCFAYIHQINLDAVSGAELLGGNLLLLVQHGLRLDGAVHGTEIDGPVAADLALNNAGDDRLHLLNKVIIYCIALLLTDLLEDDVFGNLGGNAAEGLAVEIHSYNITDLAQNMQLLRLCCGNLVLVVHHVVLGGNDDLLGPYMVLEGVTVNLDLDVVGSAEIALAGNHQCGFDGIEKSVCADILLFFEHIHCDFQFFVHCFSFSSCAGQRFLIK